MFETKATKQSLHSWGHLRSMSNLKFISRPNFSQARLSLLLYQVHFLSLVIYWSLRGILYFHLRLPANQSNQICYYCHIPVTSNWLYLYIVVSPAFRNTCLTKANIFCIFKGNNNYCKKILINKFLEIGQCQNQMEMTK